VSRLPECACRGALVSVAGIMQTEGGLACMPCNMLEA
jgi:hypothetical protein